MVEKENNFIIKMNIKPNVNDVTDNPLQTAKTE